MKKTSLSILLLASLGCVTNREKPAPMAVPEVAVEETVIPVIDKPSKLKRSTQDVDLKKSQGDKSPRKRVVILPFLDRDPDRSPEILTQARVELMNELNKTSEMVALDSAELNVDLSKWIKNGEYDLAALSQTTQKLGISSLLEAKVIDVRFKNQSVSDLSGAATGTALRKAVFEIVVKVRLVNVRTGQELFDTVKTVTLEDENTKLPAGIPSDVFFAKNPQLVELLIRDAFIDFIGPLSASMNQVVWEGRIAALQGDKIYLNVGRITGLQVGDILKVVEEGSEVYDPEIGYHIGKVAGQVKGTVEVVGYFGQDGAVGVLHSGAGFKENDRIELYE